MRKTASVLVGAIVFVCLFHDRIEALTGISGFLVIGCLSVATLGATWAGGVLAELSTPDDQRPMARRPVTGRG